jgi:antirestriction protein ArdC
MAQDYGDRVCGDAGGRESLYDSVTRRVVAELEEGRLPWVQPWRSGAGGEGARVGLPCNAMTGRSYSGINILILWARVIECGFASQHWLTFRQALAAGGRVRKGEIGTTVVYADRFTPEAEKERASQDGGDARSVAFLKRFTVFNFAQCDGIPSAEDSAPLGEREIVPVAEALIAASGVRVQTGGDHAFYAPGLDCVVVPSQTAFFDQVNYYRTALHELTHATGHRSRLDRDQSGRFGSDAYAREELIAEMGSAFLCATLRIVPTVRHADYIGSWLTVLRDDNRAIFRAASAASKAAEWLLMRHHEAADTLPEQARAA